MIKVSHSDLEDKARRWLLGTRGCKIAFTEVRAWAMKEHVDAIGWAWKTTSPNVVPESVMVECKTSKADFYADQQKSHRDGNGLGRFRYYLCPKGLIIPEEVPETWGLLWLRGSRVYTEKEAPDRGWEAGRLKRENLLLSVLLIRYI